MYKVSLGEEVWLFLSSIYSLIFARPKYDHMLPNKDIAARIGHRAHYNENSLYAFYFWSIAPALSGFVSATNKVKVSILNIRIKKYIYKHIP